MRLTIIAALVSCLAAYPAAAAPRVDPHIDRAPIDTESNRQHLIGKWFLVQPTNKGGEWRVLSTLRADGTYLMQFEESLDGRLIQKYNETGLWGVSGNIHFTITQGGSVDGKPVTIPPDRPGNYLAYEVIELTETVFIYRSIVSENRFQSRKVPDDFTMPPHQ